VRQRLTDRFPRGPFLELDHVKTCGQTRPTVQAEGDSADAVAVRQGQLERPAAVHFPEPDLIGTGARCTVEEISLDDFFRTVPSEDRPQFDQLAKVLKHQLSGVRVYKVAHETEKEADILGQSPESEWAGVKTTVVET
jgi:hypothetical protein